MIWSLDVVTVGIHTRRSNDDGRRRAEACLPRRRQHPSTPTTASCPFGRVSRCAVAAEGRRGPSDRVQSDLLRCLPACLRLSIAGWNAGCWAVEEEEVVVVVVVVVDGKMPQSGRRQQQRARSSSLQTSSAAAQK